MATEIKVPALGESITEATVAKWFKSVGDAVVVDEALVELETDKVTLEVYAPAAGILAEIAADEGSDVEVGGLLGSISEGAAATAAKPAKKAASVPGPASAPVTTDPSPAPAASTPAPTPPPPPAPIPPPPPAPIPATQAAPAAAAPLSPAVRKLIQEHGLDPAVIPATGKDGRLTKGDVLSHLGTDPAPDSAQPPAPASAQPAAPAAPAAAPGPSPESSPAPAQYPSRPAGPREERVRMTRLRQRIAERLKEAQNTAAMLSTFNEADMTAIMDLRRKYRDAFEKKHGVRIGFMSLFTKACVVALREFPSVNAEIDGTDIVYKNHYDIGVAVGTKHGLVVPVLRDADSLSIADIEKAIADFGRRAHEGKLTMDDMQGGTFTITNGGVFGSMLSTPILNPPQSGILGMHKIQQRPMVMEDGSIQARPMMYLALSYDHRIVDGREAVSFLVRVKECLEDPQRIMLDT